MVMRVEYLSRSETSATWLTPVSGSKCIPAGNQPGALLLGLGMAPLSFMHLNTFIAAKPTLVFWAIMQPLTR